MAFLLPVFWLFTGASSIGLLSSFASWAGISWLAFDNWKLKKCNELGIDPDSLKQTLRADESFRLRTAVELGIARHMGRKTVFDIKEDEFTLRHGLAGSYFLLDNEVQYFLDGMRHLELVEGDGPAADRVRELIEGTNVAYEDLSFLWEGFDCDFAKLRKLSKAREEDKEWVDLASWLMFRRTSKA